LCSKLYRSVSKNSLIVFRKIKDEPDDSDYYKSSSSSSKHKKSKRSKRDKDGDEKADETG